MQSITSVALSGTNTDSTARQFGLNFPPNGKHYVGEWVQSITMNVKLQSAKPTVSVASSKWAAVMKDKDD